MVCDLAGLLLEAARAASGIQGESRIVGVLLGRFLLLTIGCRRSLDHTKHGMIAGERPSETAPRGCRRFQLISTAFRSRYC